MTTGIFVPIGQVGAAPTIVKLYVEPTIPEALLQCVGKPFFVPSDSPKIGHQKGVDGDNVQVMRFESGMIRLRLPGASFNPSSPLYGSSVGIVQDIGILLSRRARERKERPQR
jgi:hypothetical protein